MKIAVDMMWNLRAATSPQGTSVQTRKRHPLPPVGTSDTALLQGTATPAHPGKSMASVIPFLKDGKLRLYSQRGASSRGCRGACSDRAALPERKSPRGSGRDVLGSVSALSRPHCQQPRGHLARPSQCPSLVDPSPRPEATEHHSHI